MLSLELSPLNSELKRKSSCGNRGIFGNGYPGLSKAASENFKIQIAWSTFGNKSQDSFTRQFTKK